MPLLAVMTLGSIAALRPVFYIVMGVSLMLFVWRLAQRSSGWGMRIMVFGALMLAFGYAILLPAYEAGLVQRISISPDRVWSGKGFADFSAAAISWHVAKMVVMNGGWLAFGLGAAIYAQVLRPAKSARATDTQESRNAATHESVA